VSVPATSTSPKKNSGATVGGSVGSIASEGYNAVAPRESQRLLPLPPSASTPWPAPAELLSPPRPYTPTPLPVIDALNPKTPIPSVACYLALQYRRKSLHREHLYRRLRCFTPCTTGFIDAISSAENARPAAALAMNTGVGITAAEYPKSGVASGFHRGVCIATTVSRRNPNCDATYAVPKKAWPLTPVPPAPLLKPNTRPS
jgi:hypothetical protein